MTSKKPTPKKQEPPAEQQQPPAEEVIGYATEDSAPDGTVTIQPGPVRPMAVQEPTAEDRLALVESRLSDVERWATKHNRYHFGGMTGQ
jgi:hypothetical protein